MSTLKTTIMAEILFNNSGVPLIAYGKSYQATTTGTPAEKPKSTSQPKNPDEDKLTVGNIQICVVSGKWPDTPGEGYYHVYDVLDEYDPFTDLQHRRYGNKVTGKSFIYVIRDSWGNGEYYSSAIC